MLRLDKSTMGDLPDHIAKPPYTLDERTPGIVHLGPGAFHRAHQAVYTDLAMEFGGNWRIDAVSLHSKTLKESLTAQDNLYSLMVLDNEPYTRIIGALNRVLVLQEDREAIMHSLCSPDTFIISLTITEKGYCLNAEGKLDANHPDIVHDKDFPDEPISAIGLIVAALARRKEHGHNQLTLLSCDNLSDNGKKLRNAVIAFAGFLDKTLADWIEKRIAFPNTMVDSITPATDDALRSQSKEQLGVEDRWPIQRENFSQWVIEDNFSGPRPLWEKVGVTFTDDVRSYEKAKLRILNGTHSTLAYLGSLCNIDTVYEAITNETVELFLRNLLWDEILPTLRGQHGTELDDYANAILKRYHNRHIRHLLSQIAWDGSQKLPFRILDTIRDRIKQQAGFELLCVPVAAWIVFIARASSNNRPITDPLADTLLSLAAAHSDDTTGLAISLLKRKDIFAELTENEHFRFQVLAKVRQLETICSDTLSTYLRSWTHKPYQME